MAERKFESRHRRLGQESVTVGGHTIMMLLDATYAGLFHQYLPKPVMQPGNWYYRLSHRALLLSLRSAARASRIRHSAVCLSRTDAAVSPLLLTEWPWALGNRAILGQYRCIQSGMAVRGNPATDPIAARAVERTEHHVSRRFPVH